MGKVCDGEPNEESGWLVSLLGDGTTVIVGMGDLIDVDVNPPVRAHEWDPSLKKWIQKGTDVDRFSGKTLQSIVNISSDGITSIGVTGAGIIPSYKGSAVGGSHMRVFRWPAKTQARAKAGKKL